MNRHVIIVGGGLAGLSAAFFLRRTRPELRVTVLEKAPLAGGKVGSSTRGGYTVDWAANGFLPNVPDTLELARALGIESELQEASPVAAKRFLYREGGLRALPSSPPELITSPLLLPSEKLRAALEPLLTPRSGGGEESVYAFVARHFGRGVAEAFAGPFVLGITAGDAQQLSLDALFPRLRALEREHGSVLLGLFRAQRRAARTASLARTPKRLTSFRGVGMRRLTERLRDTLGDSVHTSAAVTALDRTPQGYEVAWGSERLRADALILATPASVSARLVAPLCAEASHLLRSIPYADVTVFGLGYHRVDVPNPLDGFGFLVPRGEGVRVLGVLYSSSIFPDQAPEARVLLRVIAGGSLDPEFGKLSEAAQLAAVRRDLRVTLGIVAEPEFVERVPWPRGIPQYTLGHRERVQKARAALTRFPGLLLAGNAYDGVGVNDTVRSARHAAQALAKALTP
jgi:oxygen-dependent protoporphyrinogen oxidase